MARSSETFKPNAETLAAFAEAERGGLTRYKTVEALFEDLNADDCARGENQENL